MTTNIDPLNSENPHSGFIAQVDDLIKLLEVCHHQASRAGHAAMDAGARMNARELFASSGRLKSMVQEWERIVKQ